MSELCEMSSDICIVLNAEEIWVMWPISGSSKLTAPMGEVDHGTLSPFAFLSSDDLALSVVNLARSAQLTFLDLYEH